MSRGDRAQAESSPREERRQSARNGVLLDAGGITLSGLLAEPPDQPRAVVVGLHGGEDDSDANRTDEDAESFANADDHASNNGIEDWLVGPGDTREVSPFQEQYVPEERQLAAKELLIEEYVTDLLTTPAERLVVNIFVPLE